MAVVNADAIPLKLAKKDRWLMWDSSADTPRRPHWRGDFGISWSDRDHWHTFEEAVDAAEERGSWGIGFVFTDDLDMYAIDLDGPFNDDGEPREWFPGVEPFEEAGAYMEWSPSGYGLHIPRTGEPPEWWSDCEVEGAEHEGVDVLENKFCTFTGDALGASGDTVDDTAPARWFNEAYHKIKGGLPGTSGSERAAEKPDDDLTKEEVEEALEHVSSTLHYSEWLRVGMAVYDWDSSATGKQVFESWSRSNPKWEPERGQPHIDDIWSGSPRGDVTVGTLIHHAKQGGWEPPWHQEWNEVEVSAVEQLLDRAETAEEGLTDSEENRLMRLAGGLAKTDYEQLADGIATVVEVDRWRLDKHRDLARHAEQHARIIVEDGATWYITQTEPYGKTKVLNFPLDVNSILELDSEELIEAEIGPGKDIQFSPSKLQAGQRFRDLIADYVGKTFDPPSQGMERSILNEINQYIASLDVPRRTGTRHMGLHGDRWITPSGSLGPDGWDENPETVYVDRDISIESKVGLPENAEYSSEDVVKILRTLPETRDVTRLLPVLGWFYAAPLRPYIFEKWGTGAFNHLNITGNTGSGKTTTLRYLWRCFGVSDPDPMSVSDTQFTRIVTLAASNGMPMWYDEYKPAEIADYRLDQYHELYRKAFTGGVEQRGNPDGSTDSYRLHAPVVLSGEEQIQPPAERRRSILVSFCEEVTEKGTETRSAFKRLTGQAEIGDDGELDLPEDCPDPSDHALAYFRWLTEQNDEWLKATWEDSREVVWSIRQGWGSEHDLDDAEIQGLRTVVFGWQVMKAFADSHGVTPAKLPGRDELECALEHVVSEIGPDGQRKSHLDQFIELFGRAKATGYIERGTHYGIVHEGQAGREELRLHPARAYDAVSRYVSEHDLGGEDLLSNATDYKKRAADKVEEGGHYVVNIKQNTPEVGGRCMGINTILAMNKLDFDRGLYTEEPINPESSGGQPTSSSQGELVSEIIGLVAEQGEMDRQQLVEKISADESEVEHRIDELKKQGKLYSPEQGVIDNV